MERSAIRDRCIGGCPYPGFCCAPSGLQRLRWQHRAWEFVHIPAWV